MYYIGIDVGKFNHCALVMDHLGEVHASPFFFPNNLEGFQSLLESITPYLSTDHICGLKSTGHYGNNLTLFLLKNNFKVGLINPISTDAARKQKIRKTKNDKKDTYLICDVLSSRNYTSITLEKLQMQEMKELTRYRASLSEDLARLKTMLQKEIDIVFPEYNSLFKSKYSRTYMELLKTFPSAQHISKARVDSLAKCFKHKGKGRTITLTPLELKDKAKVSIGRSDTATTLKVVQLIYRIEELEILIEEVNKKIEDFALTSNSPIYSVPGIGTITGTAILAEISTIYQFAHASKLCAYAGLDPAVYQSGNYNAPTTAISKRGSPSLRKALYQVALPLCTASTVFNIYYKRKRNEGKSHRCAQSHVIRKLIRVIYKLLTENIPFDESVLI